VKLGSDLVVGAAALVGIGLGSIHLQAQTAPGTRASFDVVSVKASKPGTPPGQTMENGRFSANGTLFGYIEFAWDLMPTREQTEAMLAHAPKWVSADNFAIQAVAEGNPTKDQMRLLVRSLLANRFGLQVHTITEEAAVIALIPDKAGATGPKLRPHSEGKPCDVHLASPTHAVGVFPPVCGELLAVAAGQAVLVAARDVSIERIATFVSSLGILTRPVVDQTGLGGRFDFTLQFTGGVPPQDAQADDFQVTTLQEALREQLGLKLKATQARLDTLILDYVERPSEN
jgi:uncharacterized protein (TIGR03435 family)